MAWLGYIGANVRPFHGGGDIVLRRGLEWRLPWSRIVAVAVGLLQAAIASGTPLPKRDDALLLHQQGQTALQSTTLQGVAKLARQGIDAHPSRLGADQFDKLIQLLLLGGAWHELAS